MPNKSVFRLHANCIPVKGAARCVVCDLHLHRAWFIPLGLYFILEDLADCSLQEIKDHWEGAEDPVIDEYFAFLLQHDLGFWTDTPELFPALPMDWDAPSLITNAIIDIGAESRHDFAGILRELEGLGCRHVQLRYFTAACMAELEDVLRLADATRLQSIELIMPYMDGNGRILEEMVRRYARIRHVVLHGAPYSIEHPPLREAGFGTLVYTTVFIQDASHCGLIHPSLFSINMRTFTEAQRHNTCLNRKVGIDAAGFIRNCPSMRVEFGRHGERSLREVVLSADFQRIWGVGKDQIAVCRDCEFRYICTDCRAYLQDAENGLSKPGKCGYDPYRASWGEGADGA